MKKQAGEGMEWISFRILHDIASDLYSIRWQCGLCQTSDMSEPVDLNQIGNEIYKRLRPRPRYQCARCGEIIRAYKEQEEIKESIFESRIEESHELQNNQIDVIYQHVHESEPELIGHCKNHSQLVEHCLECLNASARVNRR